MKKEISNKPLFYSWVIFIIVIVVMMSIFSSEDPVVYAVSQLMTNIIQAIAVLILVGITSFYAIQTQKQAEFSENLLNEQKLKRDLEFDERRLHQFYNPYIYHLDAAIRKFHEQKIGQTKMFFDKAHRDIFYIYSYMISTETKKIIGDFIVELGFIANKEANNKLKEYEDNKLLDLLIKTRKRLHEERTKIEDYISANYPFPEREINKEGES